MVDKTKLQNRASVTFFALTAVAFGLCAYLHCMRGIGWGNSPRVAVPAALMTIAMFAGVGGIFTNTLQPRGRLIFSVIMLLASCVCLLYETR